MKVARESGGQSGGGTWQVSCERNRTYLEEVAEHRQIQSLVSRAAEAVHVWQQLVADGAPYEPVQRYDG